MIDVFELIVRLRVRTFFEHEAAAAVVRAIETVLARPQLRTRDLGGPLGTEACGRAIAEALASG